MPKRSSKRPDINEIASQIVRAATDEPVKDQSTKNPAAVALGRLGGVKGGPARAKKLSKRARVKIAQDAAKARWTKQR